jgi:hypothetical protein
MAHAEEVLMTHQISMPIAGKSFIFSSSFICFEWVHNMDAPGDVEYPEFMAIPALNNPRAGFARCKENNHV